MGMIQILVTKPVTRLKALCMEARDAQPVRGRLTVTPPGVPARRAHQVNT